MLRFINRGCRKSASVIGITIVAVGLVGPTRPAAAQTAPLKLPTTAELREIAALSQGGATVPESQIVSGRKARYRLVSQVGAYLLIGLGSLALLPCGGLPCAGIHAAGAASVAGGAGLLMITRIRGKVVPNGPRVLGRTRDGSVTMRFENRTKYPLEIAFEGEAVQNESVPANQTRRITLQAGQYKQTVRAPGTALPPYVALQTYERATAYAETFFVEP